MTTLLFNDDRNRIYFKTGIKDLWLEYMSILSVFESAGYKQTKQTNSFEGPTAVLSGKSLEIQLVYYEWMGACIYVPDKNNLLPMKRSIDEIFAAS